MCIKRKLYTHTSTQFVFNLCEETNSRSNNCLKTFFLKVNICKISLIHLKSEFVSLMTIWQPKFLFWIIFFVCLSSSDFLHFFKSILMVIISLELTRVNPDRNIFSINAELTSTFILYLQFGPSPSPNFKFTRIYCLQWNSCESKISFVKKHPGFKTINIAKTFNQCGKSQN